MSASSDYDCVINVVGGEVSEKEIAAYKARAFEQYGKAPSAIDIKIDGDEVDLKYHFPAGSFERIRRITGYLVGTLDRFNDAKRAEERDRIKHGVAEKD